MSDYSELKKLAEANIGFDDVSLAPDVVLALIAEFDRIVNLNHKQFGVALQKNREIDELKTENEALKARLAECAEFIDNAPGDLEETESLRKDADRYRWASIDGNWVARMFGKWRAHVGAYGDASPTEWYPSREEAIDAAMAKVAP